ncbi:MAG: pyrroline-5-carboxylate reductase [Lacunisphaera sp.]|nr:pyrroline-5-carboxylate reductase [Lacunisphaera sp.]
MSSPKIAFIGAGNLASAIVRGLLTEKVCAPADLACTSKTGMTAQKLAADTGITFEPDLPKLLAGADTVVIAFKPQSLAGADPRLATLTTGKLVLSVLAGKKLTRLAQAFPAARNLVRTMPNTPAAIGAGITPYCTLAPLTAGDRSTVERLLGALGQHLELGEEHMDAVTALSAGGPAFLFEYVGAMRDAGVAAGLPRATAQKLSIETVLGSARLLARDGGEPEALRDKVVSPNGTTFAGLQVLAARQFRETIKETILASTRRAGELSRD